MSAEDSGERKADEPVGRVLSVHGSQAGIGLFLGVPPTSRTKRRPQSASSSSGSAEADRC